MYKLNYKKRVWIVKQVLKGKQRIKVAALQQVSDRTVREIMQHYNKTRHHMSLHYKTPQQTWDSFKNRN